MSSLENSRPGWFVAGPLMDLKCRLIRHLTTNEISTHNGNFWHLEVLKNRGSNLFSFEKRGDPNELKRNAHDVIPDFLCRHDLRDEMDIVNGLTNRDAKLSSVD